MGQLFSFFWSTLPYLLYICIVKVYIKRYL
nr:MAG TPA: hypothetical protein [Caudoviricetes sp.]